MTQRKCINTLRIVERRPRDTVATTIVQSLDAILSSIPSPSSHHPSWTTAVVVCHGVGCQPLTAELLRRDGTHRCYDLYVKAITSWDDICDWNAAHAALAFKSEDTNRERREQAPWFTWTHVCRGRHGRRVVILLTPPSTDPAAPWSFPFRILDFLAYMFVSVPPLKPDLVRTNTGACMHTRV